MKAAFYCFVLFFIGVIFPVLFIYFSNRGQKTNSLLKSLKLYICLMTATGMLMGGCCFAYGLFSAVWQFLIIGPVIFFTSKFLYQWGENYDLD